MRFFSRTIPLSIVGFLMFFAPAQGQNQGGAAWGTVKGQIVWGGGQLPVPQPIAAVVGHMDQKPCQANGPTMTEDWVVNKDNKGIRWTFVWLAPANDPENKTKQLPIHPNLQAIKVKQVEIDQPCCTFIPHALGMREGQDLVAKNSAPMIHNIHWIGKPDINPGGNFAVPSKQDFVIKNLKVQKLPLTISCDIHKWMGARLGVFNHPYFAVTDENGNFEIKDAPAGEWRLMVWHESTGWRNGAAGAKGEAVTIKGGETTDIGKLDLKPPKK